MTFTNYYKGEYGKTVLFNVDKCENCKATIQAANSVGGVVGDTLKYKRLGIVEMAELPEEGYYSDKLGGEACYNCNG